MSYIHCISGFERKRSRPNWLYDSVSKSASTIGHIMICSLISGPPFSFALIAVTAVMLPPTLLPTTARFLPSTLISFPCSATHLVAA